MRSAIFLATLSMLFAYSPLSAAQHQEHAATESVQRLLEAQEAPVVQQMKGGSLGKGEEVKKEKEGEGWKQQQQQEQEQGKTGKKGKKGKKSKKGKDPLAGTRIPPNTVMFETVVHYAEKSGRLVMPNIDEWTNMLFPGEEIPALKCHGGEEQE